VDSGADWRGHHLPLSSWRWSHPGGRLVLAGDAAGLVNPVTGEGIYYAVQTGMLAGAAAATALEAGEPSGAGERYARLVGAALAGHFRHVALAARLFARPALMTAGVRAAARDQRVFDDFMEIALAQGRLTGVMLRGVARGLVAR
jgi:flavin-dependent dehydrogenase